MHLQTCWQSSPVHRFVIHAASWVEKGPIPRAGEPRYGGALIFSMRRNILPLWRLAQAKVEQLMKDGFDSVKLLGQAVRKEGDLLIVDHTRWVYPSRGDKPDTGRVPFYLHPNYRSYPQRVNDFLNGLLSRLLR